MDNQNLHPFQVSDGVSLRDYIDTRFDAVDQQFVAMKLAVDVANRTMETRLQGMNEFRDALKDQASKFITREELAANVAPLITAISALQKTGNIAEGRATQKAVIITGILAAGGLIISLIHMLWGIGVR